MAPESSELRASLEGLEQTVGVKIDSLSARVGELKGDLGKSITDLKKDLRTGVRSLKEDLEKRHDVDFSVMRKDFRHCKATCEEEKDKLVEEDGDLRKTLVDFSISMEGFKESRKTWNVIWTLLMIILTVFVGLVGFVNTS